MKQTTMKARSKIHAMKYDGDDCEQKNGCNVIEKVLLLCSCVQQTH